MRFLRTAVVTLLNKIHHGDCLEVMKSIPTGGVDLVLVDPPYGIDFNSNHRKNSILKSVEGILNDKDNIDFLQASAEQLYRALKNNAHMYWFTRWDKIDEQKPMLERLGFNIKNIIIWVKNNWSMGDLKGSYAGQYECILFCHKGRKELNEVDGKRRHADVLQFDRVAGNSLKHSHQKPIDLIEFLIRKSTNDGDVVLDAFVGSGTTAVAAMNTGRNFIGIEQEIEYVEIANKRIRGVKTDAV